MRRIPQSLGSSAWIVNSQEIYNWLNLAYESHDGEIWLYNNDLNIFLDDDLFKNLYLDLIAGKHSDRIHAVKFLLSMREGDPWIDKHGSIIEKFKTIYNKNRNRLSTFYFGKIEEIYKDEYLQSLSGHSWIFYTHGGNLDANSGIVMVRHREYPFQIKERVSDRFLIAWHIRDNIELQKRLKGSFQAIFKNHDYFKWINVQTSEPFNFQLCSDKSCETVNWEVEQADPTKKSSGLSLGDKVDIVIVTALQDEMHHVRIVLKNIKNTPQQLDDYYYTIYRRDGKRDLKILLVNANNRGGVPAAVVTFDAIEKWRPNHVILTGVLGGDPTSSQKLGDIIISESIIAYEYKRVEKGKEIDKTRGHRVPRGKLYTAAQQVRINWKRNGKIKFTDPDGKQFKPTVHDNINIGSGSKIVAKRAFFEDVLKPLGIGATEMEGEGVVYACVENPYHKPDCWIVIKAIMDLSDEDRENLLKDKWKDLAAKIAAIYVKNLLDQLP